MTFQINSKYGKIQFLIDEGDLSLIEGYSYYVNKVGKYFYVRVSKNGKKTYLHQLLMNPKKGLVVDHINRNTLDNRRANLRAVTTQGNLRNQKRSNNKTGTTGVALFGNKFTAQIKHNYKKIHLGVFETIRDAAIARKNAELKYWEAI